MASSSSSSSSSSSDLTATSSSKVSFNCEMEHIFKTPFPPSRKNKKSKYTTPTQVQSPSSITSRNSVKVNPNDMTSDEVLDIIYKQQLMCQKLHVIRTSAGKTMIKIANEMKSYPNMTQWAVMWSHHVQGSSDSDVNDKSEMIRNIYAQVEENELRIKELAENYHQLRKQFKSENKRWRERVLNSTSKQSNYQKNEIEILNKVIESQQITFTEIQRLSKVVTKKHSMETVPVPDRNNMEEEREPISIHSENEHSTT